MSGPHLDVSGRDITGGIPWSIEDIPYRSIVRDQVSGLYRPDESTKEFAIRLRGELGVGVEGHPN